MIILKHCEVIVGTPIIAKEFINRRILANPPHKDQKEDEFFLTRQASVAFSDVHYFG